MPIELASHPNYGPEAAKFRAAQEAATTAGDEVALATAKAEWANATARMSADLYERQDSERGRQAEIDRIRRENPDAPFDKFSGVQDIAQMEEIAKSFQALSASRPKGAQEQGSWSTPPGGGGGVPNDPEDVIDPNEQRDGDTGILPSVQRRMNNLSGTVMQKGALARKENEDLQALALEPLVARFRRRQS
jgi:hypothetical protein